MKSYTQCFIIAALLLMVCVSTAPAALQCNGCHGTSNPADNRPMDDTFRNLSTGGFPGNHRTHMDSSASFNTCSVCHPGSNSYTSSHRDGLIKVSSDINNSPLTTLYKNSTSAWPQISTPTMGTCTNVNCHFESVTPVWGSAAFASPIDCNKCHGAPPAGTSGNSYAGGAAGSHAKHYLNYSGIANCQKCHPNNTIFKHATSAGKRNLNISFAAAPNNGSGTYTGSLNDYLPSQTNTFGNCTSTYCHSPGTRTTAPFTPPNQTATWGGSLDCIGCHGGNAASFKPISTGKHRAHIYNASILGTNFGCIDCHAKTVSSDTAISTRANHVNGFVDYSGVKAGKSSSYITATGVCTSTYCHSDGKGTQKSMTTDTWKGATTLNCKGCHGSDATPAFTASSAGEPNYANGGAGVLRANSHQRHTTAGATSCDACHTNTTTTGTAIKTASALHINKTIDVTFNTAKAGASVAWTAGTKTCSGISCHGNTSAQWGGTVGCLDCHSGTIGNRAAITSQFSANSHHIQGAVTNAKCYHCHWEANIDGTVNSTYHHSGTPGAPVELVVYGASRPLSYSLTGTVTAVQYHYTTSVNRAGVQKITTHCLGCHSDNNPANPFGDGKNPKVYAWDGTSVADRYTQGGTTNWGKYATNGKSSVSKAFSAHGNAVSNAGGFDPANGVDGSITNTRGGASNVQCFDCHNSHGSTVAGITSQYSSATGRNRGGILKDTVAGKGGYAVAYKPYTGGSTANKNRRNPGASLCFDCHVTPTAGITPWGYTSTFGASQAILGYWDTPYFGSGQFPSQARYSYKSSTNKGGHYGQSGTLATPATKTIGGLCTPCHDPHGVSTTLGASMQYAVPLLKGTFLTSPYQEDVAPTSNTDLTINSVNAGDAYRIDQNTFDSNVGLPAVAGIQQSDSQFAGLCLQCHSKQPYSGYSGLTNASNGGRWKSVDRIHESVKGWGLNGKHNYSCSKCHVPHNSRLPKLMVTNCFNTPHKGRSSFNPSPKISGTNSFYCSDAEYYGGYAEHCETEGGRDRGPLSGNGNIPGNRAGVTCHESRTGNVYDQSWNNVTPWTNTTPPSAPTGISATPGNTQITISWTSGVNSTSSLVKYGTTSGVYGTTIDPATSPQTISSLANGTIVYYQVGAYNSVGTTWSTEYSVTPVLPLPSTPTGISSTPGNTQITISWTAGANSTSSLVKYGTANGVYGTTIEPAASPQTISSLANGTTIYYQVGAKNAGGTTWSTEYNVTPAVPPTLTSPTAISIGSTTATLGSNVTSNGGVALTANGTCWALTASPSTNCVDQGSHTTGVFTQGRTGLTEGSLIYYRGYATNSGGTGYSTDGTIYTEPTQPNSLSYSGIGSTGLTISWTTGSSGNAKNVIVLMKSASAVNSDPVDGTTYTSNAAFTSGTQIGTGNYVVYKGTGTSVAVTGLSASTTYHVKVYAFAAGAGGTENYNITSPLTGSQATNAPAAPTITSPTATSIGNTTATLGANVTSIGDSAVTANGTCWALTASPSTNCVDQGSHTTGVFTQGRTGLTEGSLIYYRGYATNSVGTSYSADGTIYTEPTQPNTLSFGGIGSTGLTVNWTTGSTGNAKNVIVLMKSGSAVNSDPVDGTTYTANAAFTSGTQIGTGNYVVYKGTGTSVAVTGLSWNTTYYVKVYAFAAGAGGTENYNTTSPVTGSQATSAGSSIINLTYTDTSTPYLNKNIYDDAKTTGWDGTSAVTINVTINTGVVIGSSSSTSPALITNNTPTQTFPVGTVINITNNGSIKGGGGYGGGIMCSGGDGCSGDAGGDAFVINYLLTLNNQGNISGGGGGGGGGADDHSDGEAGSGGQGAGLAGAQAGVYGYYEYHGDPGSCIAASGGDGGALGLSGNGGGDGNEGASGGAGGTPGWAITGITNVTNSGTWGNTGTFAGNNVQAVNNAALAVQTVR